MDVVHVPDYTDTNPYQRELTAALEAHDIDSEVYTPREIAPLLEVVVRHGVPDVLHVHWLNKYLVGDAWYLTVLRGIRLVLEVLILRVLGVRIVWTVHNIVEHERRTPRTETLFKHFIVRLSHAVIVHCESAIEPAMQAYRLPRRARERFVVVPHGNYIDAYPSQPTKSRARQRFEIPQDATVFLFIGRIEPYKNVPGLIEAFRSVSNPDHRLLIAGSVAADREAEIRKLAAQDERIKVHLGYVPEGDLPSYLAAADVLVLPFTEILTSGSVILGMSFGKPIIAPDHGYIHELLGETGLTYDQHDSDGLVNALQSVESTDLGAIGRRNLDRITRDDWSTVAAETAKTYQQVLAMSR